MGISLFRWFLALTACAIALRGSNIARGGDAVDFRRDVLPILSDRCFPCHGQDDSHRQAGLRLDKFDLAIQPADSGAIAIAPGEVGESELVRRIESSDPSEVMPPAKSKKPLTELQKRLLRTWIEQGAVYARHWSFELPFKSALPDTAAAIEAFKLDHRAGYGDWSRNPIDAFVLSKLHSAGLRPSVRAALHTQLRRLTFDITGLPPSVEQLDRFLNNLNFDSNEAYSAEAAELFESPHHGQRMAMWWLDVARYADTDGFQSDATRTNWPWRDWVVQAFNSHMPYDQFTIEQFAGDLLSGATPEQVLATCFHRNHMTNGEGGRDPEESRVDYVIDRINTVGTVWLGLTLGCCQCHSHKFDPISQKDYYSLLAYFNNIDEDGKAGSGAKPFLKYTSPHAARAVDEARAVVLARQPLVAAARQSAEQRFAGWLTEKARLVAAGFEPWEPLEPVELAAVAGTHLVHEGGGIIQATGPNPRQDDYRITAPVGLRRVTGLRLDILPHNSHTDGKLSRGTAGEFILTDVKLQVRRQGSSQLQEIEFSGAVADVDKKAEARQYGSVRDTLDDDPRNGWTTLGSDSRQPHFAIYALAQPLELNEDQQLSFVMLHRSTDGDANTGRFKISVTDQAGNAVTSIDPMPLEQLAACNATGASEIDSKLRQRLLDQFLADDRDYQSAKQSLDLAQDQLDEFVKASEPQNVMVLGERTEARKTNVLVRGVWNQLGEEVRPQILASLGPTGSRSIASLKSTSPVTGEPAVTQSQANRLELARWLVSKDNPLAARVAVNHLWQMLFGVGLVRTTEDFGLQGEQPTHPELLDWLAVELMEKDWRIEHILRLIVTSETYRQESRLRPELLQRDPDNRLLARGARFRLPSWMLRDAALRASGLLNPALGGPPIRPYQPDGVWEEMFMGRFHYEPSQGPAQYRRTLYAFWRRSIAPTFLFDSAQRRVCEVRVARTNTPLQALTLLNDSTMLDASLKLAASATSELTDPDEQIQFVFRRILSRNPLPQELADLLPRQAAASHYYRHHLDEARAMTTGRQFEFELPGDASQLAAVMLTAGLIFNLDEALTHE